VIDRGSEIRRALELAGMVGGALFSLLPFLLHLVVSLFLGGRHRKRIRALMEGAGGVCVEANPASSGARDFYFLAGEDSGDLHGGNLVAALRMARPDVRIRGMGGPRMAESGCDLDYDLVRMNVMGFIPVILSIGTFIGLFRRFLRMLDTDPPDVLVPVDYPGFNLRAARAARKRGVRVVYYIAPQVWAWAPWRITKIARSVDRMLVILPFERELYVAQGVPASFVGHPLFEHLDRVVPTRAGGGRGDGVVRIGLLPGSRGAEIRTILPMMLCAARRIREQHEGVRFILPFNREKLGREIEPVLARHGADLDLQVVEGRTHEVMSGLDLALVASGTASLELAYYRVPMVVMYRIGRIAACLKRFLVISPHIALVNIVGGREVVPELVGHRDEGATAARILAGWLSDAASLEECRRGLEQVRSRLLFTGVAERSATWL
jgi:lipid-A-disaccharide synthase